MRLSPRTYQLKNECKKGKETLPLYTNNYSNPVELQLNPIFSHRIHNKI